MKKSNGSKKKPKATYSKEKKVVEKKSGGRTYTGSTKKAALTKARKEYQDKINKRAAKLKASGYKTADQKEKIRKKNLSKGSSSNVFTKALAKKNKK